MQLLGWGPNHYIGKDNHYITKDKIAILWVGQTTSPGEGHNSHTGCICGDWVAIWGGICHVLESLMQKVEYNIFCECISVVLRVGNASEMQPAQQKW